VSTVIEGGTRRRTPPASLIERLRQRFGDRATTSEAVLLQHGSDESHYRPVAPDAVVFAESTDDVVDLVRLCASTDTPLIAFGAGSSVEGHLLAVEGGVCVDLSRMNRILAIQTENLTATVQAGVTREQLNRELAHSGFFFPIDPGADATLGGMVATRASGTNAVRYGTMRENVVSLTVVLADGNVIRTSRCAKKSSAGYDLTHLFTGSEGTLGIITEITVRLHPQPEAMSAAVANFPSLDAAINTVIRVIQSGIPVARAELLDPLTIRAINSHSKTALRELSTLFFEFHGSTTSVTEQAASVQDLATEFGGRDFDWALRPEERARLWTPRHHAYFAVLQLKPGSRSFTTDACVPIAHLAQCIAETIADIEQTGLTAPIFGHVGDGNFHCMILVDPNDAADMQCAEQLSHRIAQRALKFDGTCTGEHGVGLHKIDYLVEEHGAIALNAMHRIKSALDPKNILNPGKILRQ